MPGQPPQAFADAYWEDVADELARTHHAPPAEIPAAIADFRTHMAPAGQTIYNDDPAEVAETMVGHGYFASLPAVGLGLQVVFTLTDPNKVLADPTVAAKSAGGLIDALSDFERSLGGEGLTLNGSEALPGLVILSLTPVRAVGAAERLKQVSEEVERASRMTTDADAKLKTEVSRQRVGEKVSVGPYYKAA